MLRKLTLLQRQLKRDMAEKKAKQVIVVRVKLEIKEEIQELWGVGMLL